MANVRLKSIKFPGLEDTYTIPQKTSELTNDSNFLTADTVPVKSVDGATGAVVTNAVKTVDQTLTAQQKSKVHANIGTLTEVNTNAVSSYWYTGKDLTVAFADEIAANNGDPWAWIKSRITAKNYKGLQPKDYIPFQVGSTTYRAKIMGINTYKRYGDTEIGDHIDFMYLFNTNHVYNKINFNNGMTFVETYSGDGVTKTIELTNAVDTINSITVDGVAIATSAYTFTANTTIGTKSKVVFNTAPASGDGNIVINAAITYPQKACDMFYFANSLAGTIPNEAKAGGGTGEAVDYTTGGIFYNLPQSLKNLIVDKKVYSPKRYNATTLQTNSTGGGWTFVGKIWAPSEVEVYGQVIYTSNTADDKRGYIQYPIFIGNMERNADRANWWLASAYSGYSTNACNVVYNGYANYDNTSNTNIRVPVCFRIA